MKMDEAVLKEQLIAALKEALTALNVKPRFRVYEKNSYDIAAQIEKVLRDAAPPPPPTFVPLVKTNVLEVFYDLTMDYYHAAGQGLYAMERIGSDSRDRLDILLRWANEFEALHAATDWSSTEHDYYEEQEAFLALKLKEAGVVVPA